MVQGYLSGLPAFFAYFLTGMVLVGIFTAAYVRITPHDEFALIRQGNCAAVPALLGAVIGFMLPLTSAMRHGVNWIDFVIWAVIAACVQIAAFYTARWMMPDVATRIGGGEIVGGVWAGGIAIVFGMLNSASMTP